MKLGRHGTGQASLIPILSLLLAIYGIHSHAQTVESRSKPILNIGDNSFRDLNANGRLDPYEDWQLGSEERADDLMAAMTLEEKAGMMLIDTLNADLNGALPERASLLVESEHMTRFIFRNPVVLSPDTSVPAGRSGVQITPREAAFFINGVQEIAERTRLGIPVLFKSNARNHVEEDARAGITVGGNAFSQWPKEPGIAATRDSALVREFGETMAQEWTAIGLRGMYGYMADLATEPRWYRIHETFSEDANLTTEIMTGLVESIQGPRLSQTSVALTIKHFPGGGPQEGGADPHYRFGRNQVYTNDGFDYHLRPFQAAIDAGVSAIMPYYGVPVDQRYEPNDVGMAFSRGILTELLRNELGFSGYVNSDTGIIGNRAWGLESLSLNEQILEAIDAGTDVLSGFSDAENIIQLVDSGDLSEQRLDASVYRLLLEQFRLGLFDDPYVDADLAASIVGRSDFREAGMEAQRKSIVLLKNTNDLLPLPDQTDGASPRVYVMGMDPDVVRSYGYNVFSGDSSSTGANPTVPDGMDYALIRVRVTNPVTQISGDPLEPPPQSTIFGGAMRQELDLLAFSDMAQSRSWEVTPAVEDIAHVMAEVGEENTVLSIYFRQPFVLDEESGFMNAGGIVALFGVSDKALMDVIAGSFNPVGRLPFALANSAEAIQRQASDSPGYREEDTLYPFGFGLSYQAPSVSTSIRRSLLSAPEIRLESK